MRKESKERLETVVDEARVKIRDRTGGLAFYRGALVELVTILAEERTFEKMRRDSLNASLFGIGLIVLASIAGVALVLWAMAAGIRWNAQ